MDPTLSMILPKGIVVNTKDVYKEVAAYPVLPIDKIRGYWHGKADWRCSIRPERPPADLESRSLHRHQQKAQGPNGPSAGEFLVARMGQRPPSAQRRRFGQAV